MSHSQYTPPFQQNLLQGILLVRPLQARLERDTELIGSMDCYCQVIIGQSKLNTHVHNRSGKNPQWHSQLQFKLQDEQFARIAVWDKEAVKSDDLVGECEVDLQSLAQYTVNSENGIFQQNFELFYQNQKAGSVFVEFQILIDGPTKGQKHEKRRGMVIFRPTHAKLIRDTEAIGNMDPFVVIQLGKTQKKTKTHNGGGKTPKWNDTLEIRRNDEYFVEIKVLEEDVMSNDTVGEGQLSLQRLFNNGSQVQEQLDIFYDGKISGTVFFQLEWLPDTESREGTLIAFPHSAILNRDTEMMGKMDPYCMIKIGDQMEKTQVHQKAGKNPRWADELQFYRSDQFEAVIEIYDEDTMSDDLVGSAHIALQDIFQQGQKRKDVTLFYKEKEVGSVSIHWEWYPHTEIRPGIITIQPLFGEFTRNTDTFGNMDPYCKVTVGNESQQTKPHLKGGKKPKWDDELTFRRQNEHFVYISVYDKDTLSDDFVGEGKIALYDIFKKGKKRQQCVIFYKQKQIGTVTLDASWKADEELREGTIYARPIEATLDRDTDVVGKMDCYTVIKLGNSQQKTSVSKGTGKFPKWNTQAFQFPRKQEYQALVQVWDEDLTYNDLVGETSFSLFEVFQKKRFQEWIPIFYKKDQLAGKVLIEWEWRPKPSKQDEGAENRVRFINLQEGQKLFNSNLNQYFIALHNFDKLTIDDHLYDMFEQLVGQDFDVLYDTVADLENSAQIIFCEGYAELCNFFKTQIEGVAPSRENVLKLLKKFKKFLQLSQVLKHEIDNLTQVPCCHKSIEILHQYVEIYERSPDLFKIDPITQIKNQIEEDRKQGNFARKQLQFIGEQDHQKFSNSLNALKDKNQINQSRQIVQSSLQKDTKEDENYYFSNKFSRLQVQEEEEENFHPQQQQLQKQQKFNSQIPQEITSQTSLQQLYKNQNYSAKDWLNVANQTEDQNKQYNKEKVNMYSQYKGDPPQFSQTQNKAIQQAFRDQGLEQQHQQQEIYQQSQNFWKQQQEYFHNPQNLPREYQSPDTRKQLAKFPQNQDDLENSIADPSINETYRVSSYQLHQQQQFQNRNKTPELQDEYQKQSMSKFPQKQLQQQQQSNMQTFSNLGSQDFFYQSKKNFDSQPQQNKKFKGSQSVQVNAGVYGSQHPQNNNNNNVQSSRMRQSKNRIFEPMVNSTYAQPLAGTQNQQQQNRGAMQGAQFTQSRTQYYGQNLPQIQEENLEYSNKQSQQQQQQQLQQQSNFSYKRGSQSQFNNTNYNNNQNLSFNNNNNISSQNLQQQQSSALGGTKNQQIYSIQDQMQNSRALQQQKLQQSTQVQRGGRVNKDRSLFQSLFW